MEPVGELGEVGVLELAGVLEVAEVVAVDAAVLPPELPQPVITLAINRTSAAAIGLAPLIIFSSSPCVAEARR